MSIIVTLIVGGLVGYVAARLLGRHEGIIASVIIGIVGSFIGSIVSKMVSGADQSYLAFDWKAVLWSLIGSLILVALMNVLSKRTHHHA